jgi:hypothetical protein
MRAHFRAITVGALSAMLVGHATAGGLSGAIYTTNQDASFVNGNVYDGAEDVYLNGGPRANQSCTAAGLPDGDYYFQVTDPPGKTLLSGDPVEERWVRVKNGLIVEYLGATPRETSRGPCDAGGVIPTDLTVQLLPPGIANLATPNNGGEYKVWLTPVDLYNCCGGSFGFAPSYSKTDNFKVEPPEGGGIPD